MPRSHARITYLFNTILVLLVAATAAVAQSNIPTKLTVSSTQRTVGVREQTELRIQLLDQAGNGIAASYDTTVTLIATRQRDIDTAKRESKGSASFQRNGTLELPGGVNTVQTLLTIQRGHSAAALRFSSQQSGTVRIYAENERLVTGATIIVVVVKTGKATTKPDRRAAAAIFQQASFQESRPAAPAPIAPPAPAAATDYQLEIMKYGEKDAELVKDSKLAGEKEWLRRFMVQLTSGGECSPVAQDVKVHLQTVKGGGEFSEKSFVIPKNNCMYPVEANKVIELRTKSGGDIMVEARAERREGISVRPSVATSFDFPTNIRATKLLVEAVQPMATANGIESIQLRIRPVDAGNNPVRNEDENLEVRHVTLSLVSRALGLKFANGATSIPIKRGEAFIVTSVTSSCPVSGAKIVAGTENGDRQMIWGEQKLEFCFPWTQLGSAMFGGLMFPLMLTLFPGKRREMSFTGGKLTTVSLYVVLGLFLGAMAFALVFFGALGLTEFNFNGIAVTIARLPVHNWLAAIAIGFLGAAMLVKGIPFKGKDEKGEPETGEADGNESPAQA